jgi:hypothetical protein
MSNRFLDWPQENADYFKRYKRNLKRYKRNLGDKGKMYVRVDKYPLSELYDLCKLLPEGVELPTIMAAYGLKQEE